VAIRARPNVILRLKHIVPVVGTSQPTFASYGPTSDSAYSLVANPAQAATEDVAIDTCARIDRLLKEFNRNVRVGDVAPSKCCFWDTQPFYTPPVHIILSIGAEDIQGRGAYCSPECAAAHILHNPHAGSDPYEQLALLNTAYGPIYMLESPIQPAADPRGLLICFGGPLSIEDYRAVFRSGRQLQSLPRPLVKYVTEVHLVTPRLEQARVMKGARRLVTNKVRA
jgi:hypothetical protein